MALRTAVSLLLACLFLAAPNAFLMAQAPGPDEPLRLGLVGLVHGHASGFLRDLQNRTDVKIVGIAEPDREVAARYAAQFKLDESLFHTDLEAMLDAARPEAIAVFTSTFDHLQAVETAAPHGIPIMMEKPLAVSMEHARAMEKAARAGGSPLLVNYETTWYPGTETASRLVLDRNALGPLRKIVVHDGHQGPKEIGVQPEFLAWLTDPVLNGGGALTDFGCYGANLITHLMGGQRPLSVTAVTQQLKNDPVYGKVDDETTILLTYPNAQGIIQASWNWPFSRKDMEIYGTDGQILTVEREDLRVRLKGKAEERQTAPAIPAPGGDPLTYLKSVVRGQALPDGAVAVGLSALDNNLIVTEILDAARTSAATGKTVMLAP